MSLISLPLITGVDRRIIVWDISTAAQVCELKGHTDTVYQLVYSRDGTILASGGLDKCVKLWDTSIFEENGMSMDPQHWLVRCPPLTFTISLFLSS